jgi:hypothetical protein
MCEDCPEGEEVELVKLRFIGGRHKRGILRGPYLSYETDKIYMMPLEYASVPYWELVDGEVVEQTEDIKQGSEYTDDDAPTESSRGLTRAFNVEGPPSEDDFILGMDKETLKYYIAGQGGRVDGRWGRERLIKEARKLQ